MGGGLGFQGVSLKSQLWPFLCRHLWSLAPLDLGDCQVRAPGAPGRAEDEQPFTGHWKLQDVGSLLTWLWGSMNFLGT